MTSHLLMEHWSSERKALCNAMENTARYLSLKRPNVHVATLRFQKILDVWILLTFEYLLSES